MLFVSLLFAAQLREVANRIPDSRLTPATQDNMHKSWADSAVHSHSPKPHHFNVTEREAGISSPDNSSKSLKHEARLPALECFGVNSSLFITWHFTNVCTSLHGLMELWVSPSDTSRHPQRHTQQGQRTRLRLMNAHPVPRGPPVRKLHRLSW